MLLQSFLVEFVRWSYYSICADCQFVSDLISKVLLSTISNPERLASWSLQITLLLKESL